MNRELSAVERNGLHIRDPEEILHIFEVSYVQKNVDFFSKNFSKSRGQTSFKILKIHKKNCIVKVPKTWYKYVSKGALSFGEIKFCGKVAGLGGGSDEKFIKPDR